MNPRTLSLFSLVLMGLLPAQAQITVDGTRDTAYGQPLAIQLAPTGFGDNTDDDPLIANGSELNAAYAVIRDGYLHLFLAGNLETNFNKLEIFIDSIAAEGQNQLGATNPNVDFDGLNAMAGLTFDTDFAADFYMTASGGNSPVEFFFNFAEVKDVGSEGSGNYIGQTAADAQIATLTNGIEVGIDNSNTDGVTAIDAATPSADDAPNVSTGIELKIPLAVIGNPTNPVKICAFINSSNHTFLSNQILGSLPADFLNLGAPGSVNFENNPTPTKQFFTATVAPVTSAEDYGPGSLRQTISLAPAGSTITFDPSVFDGEAQDRILVSSTIDLSTDIIIDGSTPSGAVEISGGPEGSAFFIPVGTEVTLRNLHVRDRFSVFSGAVLFNEGTALLERCSLTGNSAGGGGGALVNSGASANLTIRDSTLSGNMSSSGGAILIDSGTATIERCTIVGNRATSGNGGGVSISAGSLTLQDSILAANSASDLGPDLHKTGGSVVAAGTNLLGDNSTVETEFPLSPALVGNTAAPVIPGVAPLGDYGGSTPTMPPLEDSPALDAAGTTDPGGTDQRGNPRLSGAALDIGAVERKSGDPVRTDFQVAVTSPIDGATGVDLRPTFSWAAPTFGVAPDEYRIWIDGQQLASTTSLSYQVAAFLAGLTSHTLRIDTVFGASVIPGVEVSFTTRASLVLVDTIVDENDGSTIGGISLRDAIAAAEPGEPITFVPALSGQTITLANGQMTLDKDLVIDASGLPSGLTIDAAGGSRIFEIIPDRVVELRSLTLSNGQADGNGAAILNNGDLTIEDCTFQDNVCLEDGGAIASAGFLTVHRSTFTGNEALNGGAIGLSGDTLIANSTFKTNSSSGVGGAIHNFSGTLDINNSTFSGNTAILGGGINSRGTLNINNSIVATNTASSEPDIRNLGGTVNAGGGNLIGDNSSVSLQFPGGTPNSNGDLVGTSAAPLDPLLAPLGDYGGPTPTMPPLPGSPAIDAAGTTDPAGTDQRGLPRFVNGALDIGAVESGSAIPGFVSTEVTDGGDLFDGLGGAGVSLREAIAFSPSGAVISFSPTLSGQTITLGGSQLFIDQNLTIDASGLSEGLVVDADNNSRLFEISAGNTVELKGMTLRNGSAANESSLSGGGIYNLGALSLCEVVIENCVAGDGADGTATSTNQGGGSGGAIYSATGSLLIEDSTLRNNSAGSGGDGFTGGTSPGRRGGHGGAVMVASGSLTVLRSTLSGNQCGAGGNGSTALFIGGAGGSGGGIYGAGGTMVTVRNSTITGNAAADAGSGISTDNFFYARGGYGGGLYLLGDAVIDSATLFGNSASTRGGGGPAQVYNGRGGGIYRQSGLLTLRNSIVAMNSALTGGPDHFDNTPAPAAVEGVNLFSDLTDSDLSAGSSVIVGDPLLAPLGDYGGPTPTILPRPGSPVIDAAGTTNPGGTDQRGFDRFLDGNEDSTAAADIGAVEFNPATDADGYAVEITSPVPGETGLTNSPTISWTASPLGAPDAYEIFIDGVFQGQLTTTSFNIVTPLPLEKTQSVRVDALYGSTRVVGEAVAFTTRASTVVDSTADPGIRGDGETTLREALADAESGEALTFHPLLSGGTITLTAGQLVIERDVSIDASTLGQAPTIDANGALNGNRAFRFQSGVTATLSSLVITGGRTPDGAPGENGDGGGGILNEGDLTLIRVAVTGNATGSGGETATIEGNFAGNGGDGGGILSQGGSLTLIESTVSNNQAGNGGSVDQAFGGFGGRGGGICVLDSTVRIERSTISGNTAGGGGPTTGGSTIGGAGGNGGGIFALGDTLYIENSTIAANTAGDGGAGGIGGSGGGIDAGLSTRFEVVSCTVSGNAAGVRSTAAETYDGTGGGIVARGAFVLESTIVSANFADSFPEISGTPSNDGNNLMTGTPRLAPLGDYGGSTQTMPPLPGSPAIDAATGSTAATDQRGFARPNGPAPDIGAVEAYPFGSLGFVDTEPDGIDDRLEIGFFGNTTTANATSDSDGDGSSDKDEIANMTDPNDPNDFFRILSFTKAAGFDPQTNPVFDITVKTFPGLGYRLERQQDLSTDFDLLDGGEFTADGFSKSFQIELMPGRDFIRAVRE